MKFSLCQIILIVGLSGLSISVPITDPIVISKELEILPDEVGKEILEKEYRGGRVVYGSTAAYAQFPFYTLIIIYLPSVQLFCGSTLISNTWIVSAAHCITSAVSAQAFFGNVNRNAMPVQRNAEKIMYLSTYNTPTPVNNDISLLKLQSAVTFATNIQPIRLPPRSDMSKSFSGVLLTGMGFGKTTTGYPTNMQYTSLTGITNGVCLNYLWVVTSKMLCAKSTSGLSSVCAGDSGGPLTRTDSDGIVTFVGINSFVQTEDCVGNMQGFTRVDQFLDFISYYSGVTITS